MQALNFDPRTPWYKRMKLHRVNLDLKQEEAAALIGVPIRTYQRWENGDNVPIAAYRKLIAEAFKTSEAEIFNEPTPGRRGDYKVGE